MAQASNDALVDGSKSHKSYHYTPASPVFWIAEKLFTLGQILTQRMRLPKVFCHEVAMYDLFGAKYIMSISRFVKIMIDPKGIVFLGLGALLLAATDPNDLRSSVSVPMSLVIYTIGVSCYLAVVIGILAAFSYMTRRFGPFLIYTPITSASGMLCAFVCVNSAVVQMTGGSHSSQIFPVFFNLMGAGLIIELLFVRFVMPLVVTPAANDEAPTILRISDRQIPVAKVAHIMSQEHYLQVKLQSETLLIRARLSDAVAQTTAAQGIQPHRSWWVAATARPKLEKANGKNNLLLSDGTTVPIAKARMSEVQNWLDLYSDW